MAEYSKLGYGEFGKIDTAVEQGILDGKDIVITKDTSEFIYIRDDKTKQIIRSRVPTFDTEAEAVSALNAASDTYAGQPVAIKGSDGKYKPYTVQHGESGFIVEAVAGMTNTTSGFLWQEF